MPDTLNHCLWKNDCPLAGLCQRVLDEPQEIRVSWFAPTALGKDCAYFMPETPKDEEKKA